MKPIAVDMRAVLAALSHISKPQREIVLAELTWYALANYDENDQLIPPVAKSKRKKAKRNAQP